MRMYPAHLVSVCIDAGKLAHIGCELLNAVVAILHNQYVACSVHCNTTWRKELTRS